MFSPFEVERLPSFSRRTSPHPQPVPDSGHLPQHPTGSVALHFMHYNFVKIHSTQRTTRAQAAGVADRLWEIEDLIALLEE